MRKFLDLTLMLEDGTRALDLDPITFVNKYRSIYQDGYNLSQVILSSHVGTHIDAPYHFLEQGVTLDRVPLDRLIGNARLLDFSYKKAKELITRKEIESYDSVISRDDIIILRTDWYKKFPSHEYGYDNPNVSTEAVKYLVQKKIKMLAVESPTLNWEDNPDAHKILLSSRRHIGNDWNVSFFIFQVSKLRLSFDVNRFGVFLFLHIREFTLCLHFLTTNKGLR